MKQKSSVEHLLFQHQTTGVKANDYPEEEEDNNFAESDDDGEGHVHNLETEDYNMKGPDGNAAESTKYAEENVDVQIIDDIEKDAVESLSQVNPLSGLAEAAAAMTAK